MADEDYFLDDDLDAIPDSTLQALEQNAFRSTQYGGPLKTLPARGPNHLLQNGRLRSGLQQPSRLHADHGNGNGRAHPPAANMSFEVDDDESVVDLAGSSMVIRPARHPVSKTLDPETAKAFAAADEELRSASVERIMLQNEDSDQSAQMAALLAKVAELEAQQVTLREAEQAAVRAAEARKGEIQIVRANQEKMRQDYESRMQALGKQHSLEVAEQKSRLDASLKEKEKMQTDNRFLQHDIAQNIGRTRPISTAGKARNTSDRLETPKKSRRDILGDGFDDDEVRLSSPSKSKERSREQTPKAGVKRKRNVQDSPVVAFPNALVPELHRVKTEPNSFRLQSDTLSFAHHRDERFEFMQLILNHCYGETDERTIETLAKFHFPSEPRKSLAALLLDDVSRFNPSLHVSADKSLPMAVSRCLLKLWSRCLDEEAYDGFVVLLDLLGFALFRELKAKKSQLVEEAVPLCLRAIDLTALPAVRASTNSDFAATLDSSILERNATLVPVDSVLEFLQDLCFAATLSSERIEMFWRCMAWDFVLMMLHKIQPINHMTSILRMIKTSALPSTFGVIHKNPERQGEQERILVDRLTSLIFEKPEVPADEPPYNDEEILELRLDILGIFRELCMTQHGESLLCRHRSVIGRLVRFLDQQVRELYTGWVPSVSASTDDNTSPHRHTLNVQVINTTTRILHHLICNSADGANINMGEKLQAVMGGYHKFLTSLTRIAFSEQLVFEAGIENEVAEAAHAILDSVLGPEDGEAVMKAIETPRGSNKDVVMHDLVGDSSQPARRRSAVPEA